MIVECLRNQETNTWVRRLFLHFYGLFFARVVWFLLQEVERGRPDKVKGNHWRTIEDTLRVIDEDILFEALLKEWDAKIETAGAVACTIVKGGVKKQSWDAEGSGSGGKNKPQSRSIPGAAKYQPSSKPPSKNKIQATDTVNEAVITLTEILRVWKANPHLEIEGNEDVGSFLQ